MNEDDVNETLSSAQLVQLNLELEQRVAERTAQLEKSEAQQRAIADDLRTVFDTVTDGLCIADIKGNLLVVNDAFVKLYGCARKQDLIGKTAIELVAERDRERARELLSQVLVTGPSGNLEYRLVRLDGTEFDGEVCISPIHDESRFPIRFVVITRDVTERKSAELRLRASREYARNIIESSLDMIIAVDMERQITEFNNAAEETFGYRREEVLGQSIELLYADSDESKAVYTETMSRGQNVRQIRNKTKNGRIFPTLLSASLLRDPHGTPIGSMGISRDVTELMRAQEEQKRLLEQVKAGRERLQLLSKKLLDAQENERRHIARELHDEIGQEITGVQMNLQLIEPFVVDPSARIRLEDTTLAIERMLQQIRNLSLDLRPSILDDFGLVPALRWLVERQATRTSLDIQFTADAFDERVPEPVENVCFRVTQEALTNIIRHAHAAHISVRLRHTPADLELTIQDDGIGFDIALAAERAAQNNSMGLLGMQERVILIGGSIDITSAPQHGTRIHAIVPIDASHTYKERRRQWRSSHETRSRPVG